MGDGASISSMEAGIEKRLKAMLTRAQTLDSYLNSVLMKQYQKAQIARWESGGSSEGSQWPAIDPDSSYGKRKPKLFASYPGGGRALMVAKGKLASGAQARDAAYFYKIVTNSSFTIGINLGSIPYAAYPGRKRPYMTFSTATLHLWKSGIMAYVSAGKK